MDKTVDWSVFDWSVLFLMGVMIMVSIYSMSQTQRCRFDYIECNETYLDVRVCYYTTQDCDNIIGRLADGMYNKTKDTIFLNNASMVNKETTLRHEYCHHLGGDEFKCYTDMILS